MLSDTVKNGQKGASKTSAHPKLKLAQNNLEKTISKSYQKDMPSQEMSEEMHHATHSESVKIV